MSEVAHAPPSDDVDKYRDGFFEFFARARWQNIVGQSGASITGVAFGWAYADHGRLIAYLVIHQLLVLVMAVTFTSRWTTRRLDSNGIPRFATRSLLLTQGFCGSLMWLDLEASRSPVFALSSLIVMYACAAGTMVTLGPLQRLARLALMSLLLPGAVAALWVGHWVLGLGTFFFLAVVAVVGVTEMSRSYRELIDLRVQSQRFADEMKARAHHDSLTGLLNRNGLAEAFEQSASAYRAALYIDLDHFKQVNDKAGHLAGDELLQRVAQRLTNRLSADAQIARLGGDEFFVLTVEHDEDTLRSLPAELIEAIEAPYRLRRGTHSISASIGVALIEPGDSLETAVHRSDQALLTAKAKGRGAALFSTETADSTDFASTHS